MKKDDKKTLIVILVVCVICGAIIFLASRKNNFEKLAIVNDYSTFFSVTQEVNNYINYIAMGNMTTINDLLDSKFIKNNTDNLILYDNYSPLTSLKVNRIDYVKIGKNYLYFVVGVIVDNGFESVKIIDDNFKVLVLHDLLSNSYSIYPVNNDNYKNTINSIKNINVVNNNENEIITIKSVKDIDICKLYFSNFVSKLLNNTEDAYNLLGDTSKKKYPTYEDFKKYINDNVEKITPSSKLCKKDEYKDSRVYSVIDSNDNSYTFTENGVMNYRVNFYFNNRE